MGNKHICNKEVEITQIRSDVAYIKKALAGNGEKGLIKDTRTNTEFRIKFEGLLNNMEEIIKKVNNFDNYNRLKNWILGSAITTLGVINGFLVGYVLKIR